MREKMTKWKFIAKTTRVKYPAGIRAGQFLLLKSTIRICDHKGVLTGKRYNRGGTWIVLTGVRDNPNLIFLRAPDGAKHTWDGTSIFESFARRRGRQGEGR